MHIYTYIYIYGWAREVTCMHKWHFIHMYTVALHIMHMTANWTGLFFCWIVFDETYHLISNFITTQRWSLTVYGISVYLLFSTMGYTRVFGSDKVNPRFQFVWMSTKSHDEIDSSLEPISNIHVYNTPHLTFVHTKINVKNEKLHKASGSEDKIVPPSYCHGNLVSSIIQEYLAWGKF